MFVFSATSAAEALDSFGDLIDHLGLGVLVFVEQQVQLIKRCASNLPMMLLVKVAERHGVHQNLVQPLDALPADRLAQSVWQFGDSPESLNLGRALPSSGPG